MGRTHATSSTFHDSVEHGSHERSTPSGDAGRRFRGSFATFWIPRLRPFAVAALLCLLYQVAAPWQYAEAQPVPAPSRSGLAPRAGSASPMPEIGERLDQAVRHTRGALDRLGASSGRAAEVSADLDAAADRCETAFGALEAIDGEVLNGYREVGDHLRKSGLGAQVRVRNDAAERAYRGRFQEIRHAVKETVRLAREQARASRAGDREQEEARRAEVAAQVARAEDLLAEMVAPPPQVPLDPENLPHRVVERQPRAPRLSSEQFDELSSAPEAGVNDGVKQATRAATAPVLGFAAAAPPGPEDLAETADVQLTPEIRALAGSLGHDPLAIFDFVHDEIELTWTFGSIQGAASCLSTRRCNAFDTASLLIALFRASGIPARYAMGTVEVPIGEIEGLAGGFTDTRSALQLIASSGTPVTAVGSGGAPTAARFEHVWVEAFLDYVPSRGVREVAGDTWVPLDPSFKQTRFVDAFDALGTLGFDSGSLLQSILDGAQIDQTNGVVQPLDTAPLDAGLADLQQQVETLAQSPDTPATARGLLGGPEVVSRDLPALPGALPYQVLVRAGQFSEVPASLRHQLHLEVAGDFLRLSPDLTYTASLPALAGKRITLSYVPATDDDAAILLSFLPSGDDLSLADLPTAFPAYLVRMRPELKVDGEIVATGGAATLGQTGRFRLVFSGPGTESRTVDNAVTAGSYSALVLDLTRIENPEPRRVSAEALLAKLQGGDASGVGRDDVLGELLHVAGMFYWLEVEIAERAAAGERRVAYARLPSEGIFALGLRVESLFGAPLRVSPGALVTDVDSDLFAVASLDGESGHGRDFAVASGILGSRTESAIWDTLVHGVRTGRGIDAMSYLDAARRRGIPLDSIDAGNVATALPQLEVSSAVKRDIENAVHAGRVVTVPQRAFELDGFSGVGYVTLDPDTGSAAYLIATGLAGGGYSFENELDTLGQILFNFALTLGAEAFPMILIPLLLIAIVTTLVAIVTAITLTALELRNNPNLTQKQKVAIILGVAAKTFLDQMFLLAGSLTVPLRVTLTLDVAGPVSDYIVDRTVDFFVGDTSSPVVAGPVLAMEVGR